MLEIPPTKIKSAVNGEGSLIIIVWSLGITLVWDDMYR